MDAHVASHSSEDSVTLLTSPHKFGSWLLRLIGGILDEGVKVPSVGPGYIGEMLVQVFPVWTQPHGFQLLLGIVSYRDLISVTSL